MFTKARPLIVALFVVLTVFGQTDMPIEGTVVTRDGQPIEGVNVYGSLGKCCPVRAEQTTTDKKGEFRIARPGAVIHFFKQNLQPQSIVIQSGNLIMRITMSPVTNAINVLDCGPLQPTQTRIGFGQYGLQFTVSGQSLDVQGGKPDVDYGRYVIRRKQSQSFMELWLGPTAMRLDPDDDRFIDSSDFAQRVLLYRNSTAGFDSRGHLRSGESWRHTAMGGLGGAVYNKVSSEDAVSFDQVIDSICFVPFPSK